MRTPRHVLGVMNWIKLWMYFGIFPNLFEQMSLRVVYLLSLGCAAHLYSWGSYAGVNVIS